MSDELKKAFETIAADKDGVFSGRKQKAMTDHKAAPLSADEMKRAQAWLDHEFGSGTHDRERAESLALHVRDELQPIVRHACQSDPRMLSECSWPACGCEARGDWPPGAESAPKASPPVVMTRSDIYTVVTGVLSDHVAGINLEAWPMLRHELTEAISTRLTAQAVSPLDDSTLRSAIEEYGRGQGRRGVEEVFNMHAGSLAVFLGKRMGSGQAVSPASPEPTEGKRGA